MNTYKTCGSFDIASLTAKVNTYLPNQKGLICNYVSYYNISSSTEFGVLGVMTDNQGNTDLRLSSTKVVNAVAVQPQPIALKSISSTLATRKLDELKVTDTLYFICYHENSFDPIKFKEILAKYNSLVDLIAALDGAPINTIHPFIPGAGNGGILTAEGSC